MGQISLPRFNRLNVSMNWESFLKTNNYNWLTLKLHFILKFLVPHFFRVTMYNFFNIWGPVLKASTMYDATFSGFVKKNFPTTQSMFYLEKAHKPLVTVLKIYLCRLDNFTYIFVIYNKYKKFKLLLKQARKRKYLLKKKSNFLLY